MLSLHLNYAAWFLSEIKAEQWVTQVFGEEDAIFDLSSQAACYGVVQMGPETKKHDNDQTNKQTNIIYSTLCNKD